MRKRDKSVKKTLQEYLANTAPAAIGEKEWNALAELLAPVSESYLRELLRATGLPVAQPWAGIRQHTFEELESTLEEMRQVYAAAMASGDHRRARYARRVVISAKDHARYAARNRRASPERRAQKEEMVRWMLVWLEDPAMFPAWVEIRKLRMPGRGDCPGGPPRQAG